MNEYDHEDAFKAANLCAGRLTKLSDALCVATDKYCAELIIADCQKKYADLFTAFIEGVDYGRRNPKWSKAQRPTDGKGKVSFEEPIK